MADATIPKFARARAVGASWRTQLLNTRDRLLRDARFQRWSSRFVLTRLVARHQSRAAFDLCAGFVYSQILKACLELDLLVRLAEQPSSTADLAKQCDVPPEKMERLLVAATALKLVERRGGETWGLGMTGAAISGTPGLSDMVRHHALLYDDLRDPVALLRAKPDTPTHLSRYWGYATSNDPAHLTPENTAQYSQLMTRSQAMISDDIIEAYPLHGHRKLIDIGGGEGGFIGAVARATPNLRLALFDLPAVAARAKSRLEAAGLGERIEITGGSFFTDPIPAGADIATLVRILHDHDDAAALQLLRNIRASLMPNGRLLIAEPMAETPGAAAMGDAYFGFYLLAMGSGRPRSPSVIFDMLRTAGFRSPRLVATARPMLVRIIIADA